MTEQVATEEQAVKTESAGAKESSGMAIEGKMAEFVDWIETISVLELSRLVKALEERLGVSAAAPMAVAASGGAASGAQSAAPEEAQS